MEKASPPRKSSDSVLLELELFRQILVASILSA